MSHASVLVVGKNVEAQMEKWSNHSNKLDGKWDWYVIGGRWDGELILKDRSKANQALARQVDWRAMDARNIVRHTNDVQHAKDYEAKHGRPYPFWEDYEPRLWIPFACLIDGDWRQKGTLLAFGQIAEDGDEGAYYEGFQAFRDSLRPTRELTIVDFHQ